MILFSPLIDIVSFSEQFLIEVTELSIIFIKDKSLACFKVIFILG